MALIKALPQDLQKIVEDELNETPERIIKDLQSLKEWLVQQPHLKARLNDQFLIQFLRGCKYSLERAKEKLDRYYTMKTKFPEMLRLTNVDDPKFRQSYRLNNVCILPEPLNGNGPRITVIRFSEKDFDVTMDELWLAFLSVYEILIMEDPYACISGFTFIVDYAECTPSHVLRYTPSVVKKWVTFLEMCLPLRIKGAHIINSSPAFSQFLNMVVSLFSSKIRERVTIMGRDYTALHEKIPQKYLPQEYGGENGCITDLAKNFETKFDEYRDYFKEMADYGVNEKLRIGQGIDFDTMFGMGGSFRKLDVD